MFTRYQMPIIITWHAFSAQNHRTNICYAIPWRKCAVISKYHFLFVNQEATEHKITNFRFSVNCLFGKTLSYSKYLTQQTNCKLGCSSCKYSVSTMDSHNMTSTLARYLVCLYFVGTGHISLGSILRYENVGNDIMSETKYILSAFNSSKSLPPPQPHSNMYVST